MNQPGGPLIVAARFRAMGVLLFPADLWLHRMKRALRFFLLPVTAGCQRLRNAKKV